jgi:hypothetical protein
VAEGVGVTFGRLFAVFDGQHHVGVRLLAALVHHQGTLRQEKVPTKALMAYPLHGAKWHGQDALENQVTLGKTAGFENATGVRPCPSSVFFSFAL